MTPIDFTCSNSGFLKTPGMANGTPGGHRNFQTTLTLEKEPPGEGTAKPKSKMTSLEKSSWYFFFGGGVCPLLCYKNRDGLQ